jgi:hypothetical protein
VGSTLDQPGTLSSPQIPRLLTPPTTNPASAPEYTTTNSYHTEIEYHYDQFVPYRNILHYDQFVPYRNRLHYDLVLVKIVANLGKYLLLAEKIRNATNLSQCIYFHMVRIGHSVIYFYMVRIGATDLTSDR